MHDPEELGDDLDAARGIINGCILGAIMWAFIIAAIRWLW